MRYDIGGAWQGTTRIGSGNFDVGSGLAGNTTHLLVAGSTTGEFDGQASVGNNDAFLSKRDSTGAVVWTRIVGGFNNAYDTGRAAAFDGAGNAYLAGDTTGSFTGFTNAGSSDIFVARYDTAGNQTLLQQIGTSAIEYAYDVEVDVSGNIYLTGTTEELDSGGNIDAYVMKLDSNGNVLWKRFLGGTSPDRSLALGVDGAGHVWIGGDTWSTFGGHTSAGQQDAYVAEYDNDGSLIGMTFLATGYSDVITGLAIGPDGAAYVTGYTNGTLGLKNFDGYDVFVAKLDATAAPEPSTALLLAAGGLGILLRRRRA